MISDSGPNKSFGTLDFGVNESNQVDVHICSFEMGLKIDSLFVKIFAQ